MPYQLWLPMPELNRKVSAPPGLRFLFGVPGRKLGSSLVSCISSCRTVRMAGTFRIGRAATFMIPPRAGLRNAPPGIQDPRPGPALSFHSSANTCSSHDSPSEPPILDQKAKPTAPQAPVQNQVVAPRLRSVALGLKPAGPRSSGLIRAISAIRGPDSCAPFRPNTSVASSSASLPSPSARDDLKCRPLGSPGAVLARLRGDAPKRSGHLLLLRTRIHRTTIPNAAKPGCIHPGSSVLIRGSHALILVPCSGPPRWLRPQAAPRTSCQRTSPSPVHRLPHSPCQHEIIFSIKHRLDKKIPLVSLGHSRPLEYPRVNTTG